MTRPDLFASYLEDQIRLLIENHNVPVTICTSETPIPLHFAFNQGTYVEGSIEDRLNRPLRDVFDVPDLASTDDRIVNGQFDLDSKEATPLAPFTAQRVDYSLHRLRPL